ncbi:MAG: carbohydrate-binding family 9-like protein [Paludibacter sp.]|nr:carbohydrate-binding family 9-like protein [Bacteroidales bacterium]MCM1068902.1 carbohydrate-binding family 9-like protein [Prevotella sp.]MCM1353163.1 carbohydrate-binding family 9-like protein [Bacteroides sp.]MCM1442485.1 carbohydrate-binding family 9-like protein [Muribaculum sp.]MCM1481328.1 carbohydrate-binding family 9-like protein [Paludibacter sp.]
MNKHLHIPFHSAFAEMSIEQINAQLDDIGTAIGIDQANWANQYPYIPLTTVYIARSDKKLFIKWHVNGIMLKAVYTNDLEPVWKDSCVEFFCKLPDADQYMNFEFNCIGTATASTRTSRTENIVYRTPEEFAQIERYSSLGKRPFREIDGQFCWDLCVGIPFSLLNIDPERLPEKLLGNFYKCADDTTAVHYVSWNPIPTDKPDFHRPDFFGELYF